MKIQNKMKKLTALLLSTLMAVMCFGTIAYAADEDVSLAEVTEVYLSDAGDDANNGTTADTPKKTLAAALAAVSGTAPTIYIVGTVTFPSSNTDVSKAGAALTITGVDETSNILAPSGIYLVSGPLTISNLAFRKTGSGDMTFITCGNDFTVGEGVSCSFAQTNKVIRICADNYKGTTPLVLDNAVTTVNSGTFGGVFAAGFINTTTKGTGSVVINGGNIARAAVSHYNTTAANPVSAYGTYNITVNAGSVTKVYAGGDQDNQEQGLVKVEINGGIIDYVYTSGAYIDQVGVAVTKINGGTIKNAIDVPSADSAAGTVTRVVILNNGKDFTVNDSKAIVVKSTSDGSVDAVTTVPTEGNGWACELTGFTAETDKKYVIVDDGTPIEAVGGKASIPILAPGVHSVAYANTIPLTTVYLSDSGNDTNDGATAETPLKTSTAALATLTGNTPTIRIVGAYTAPTSEIFSKKDAVLTVEGVDENSVINIPGKVYALDGDLTFRNIALKKTGTSDITFVTMAHNFTFDTGVSCSFTQAGKVIKVAMEDYGKEGLGTVDNPVITLKSGSIGNLFVAGNIGTTVRGSASAVIDGANVSRVAISHYNYGAAYLPVTAYGTYSITVEKGTVGKLFAGGDQDNQECGLVKVTVNGGIIDNLYTIGAYSTQTGVAVSEINGGIIKNPIGIYQADAEACTAARVVVMNNGKDFSVTDAKAVVIKSAVGGKAEAVTTIPTAENEWACSLTGIKLTTDKAYAFVNDGTSTKAYSMTDGSEVSLLEEKSITLPITAAGTYTVNYANVAPQTVIFKNGAVEVSNTKYYEGQSIAFPSDPTPETGMNFDGWFIDKTSYTEYVMGDSPLTFEAKFVASGFEIMTAADPTAGGNVSGSGTFAANAKTTLIATPNEGYSFAGWYIGADKASDNTSYEITVTEAKTYTAKFTLNSYAITVNADPTVGGNVSGGGTFSHGAKTTLIATPNGGYTFAGWYIGADKASDSASYEITVTEAKTYTAKFKRVEIVVDDATKPAGITFSVENFTDKTNLDPTSSETKVTNIKATLPEGTVYKAPALFFEISAVDGESAPITSLGTFATFKIYYSAITGYSAEKNYILFHFDADNSIKESVTLTRKSDCFEFDVNTLSEFVLAETGYEEKTAVYSAEGSYDDTTHKYTVSLYLFNVNANAGAFGFSYDATVMSLDSFIHNYAGVGNPVNGGIGLYKNEDGIYADTWAATVIPGLSSCVDTTSEKKLIGTFVFSMADKTLFDPMTDFALYSYPTEVSGCYAGGKYLTTLQPAIGEGELSTEKAPSIYIGLTEVAAPEYSVVGTVRTVREAGSTPHYESYSDSSTYNNLATIKVYCDTVLIDTVTESAANATPDTVIDFTLAVGTYTLEIIKNGYLTYSESFNVTDETDLGIINLIPGDIKGAYADSCGNGTVDVDDFVRVIRGFDTSAADLFKDTVDIDENGTVGIDDLVLVKTHFKKTTDCYGD